MNNDSSTPQRQLANVFTQAFLQHLQNTSDDNANTAMGNIVRQIFANVSLATPSPVTPTTRPRTPADMRFTAVNTPEGTAVNTPTTNSEPGTPLSRASSMSSTTTNGSDADFEIRRRNSTPDQMKTDNRAVTPRVLGRIDASILALHPDVQNPMFRRQFKRGYNSFGRRTLKRHKDIDLPVFRDETRQVLRELVNRDFPTLRAQDPSLTYQELRTRYYNAALRVVKKRRANHIQSWRPENNGTHLPLIYGGVFTAVPPGALPPSATTPPAPSAGVANIETVPSTVSTTAPSAGVTITPSAVATTTPTSSTVSTMSTTSTTTSTPSTSTVVEQQSDGVDFPDEREPKMSCSSCGVELLDSTAFPKDRWGENAKVSCEKCWKVAQNNMVCAHVQDPSKRKAALDQVNAGRRKRVKRTKCKHCGSKTHLTIRSKKCPYNKVNATAEGVVTQVDAPAEPETVEVEAQVQNEDNEDYEESQRPEDEDWDAPIGEDEVFDVLSDQSTQEPQFSPMPGDNVLVTLGKQVFLAQLVKVEGDDYHVYYVGAPDDDDTGVVNLNQLKPETTPTRKRRDFLNTEFYFDGADDLECGRWKVRRIKGNEFVCVRLSGGTCRSQNLESFDISYVMDQVRVEDEYIRERGPGWSGRR